MRVIITTGALCAAIGAATGWMNAADYYEAKARKLLEETEKAEQVRAEKSQAEVDELYEKWRDAIVIPEPVTVVERVFIRAKCPVQANPSTKLDHGADGDRIELAERTVRSVERVAIKHEQNYNKCAAQLAGAQALLRSQ